METEDNQVAYEEIDGFKTWLKNNYGMSLTGMFRFSLQNLLRLTLVQQFLRKIHQIDVTPIYTSFDEELKLMYYDSSVIADLVNKENEEDVNYKSTLNFEKALKKGILEALKLLENDKQQTD